MSIQSKRSFSPNRLLSLHKKSHPPLEWIVSDTLVDYETALSFMESRSLAIQQGEAPECVWLLEHPSLYTAGTSSKNTDLLIPDLFPIFHTGRGGQYTYHGPGQRIAYVMLDLNQRLRDVRAYVAALEEWIIRLLRHLTIVGNRHEERVGIWVYNPKLEQEEKIAAIGIRIRHWVTTHGIALNVNPNLEHFKGIVPCGLQSYAVTSLEELSTPPTMSKIDMLLRQEFTAVFGD